MKLFRLVLSTERTDYVVTNDMAQDAAQAAKEKRSLIWKIEQFHRQAKQVTGVEKCQCRKQRAQRNHMGCAMLVWVRLNRLARQTGQTPSSGYCPIICVSNSVSLLSACLLRKSYPF